MPGTNTSVLEILDLEFVEGRLRGGRQRITSPPGARLEVALPSTREPVGLDSDKKGVIRFKQVAGVCTVTRGIQLEMTSEPSGARRYRWTEVASSRAQLAAAIMPKGFALTDAEPRPVASRVVNQRLVVYWAPKGASISMRLERFSGDLRTVAKRINRHSPMGGEVPDLAGIVPIRPPWPAAKFGLPIAAAVLIIASGVFIMTRLSDKPVSDPDGQSSTVEIVGPSDKYARSYALVVGIDRYPPSKWQDLSYAKKDAQGVAGFLEDSGFQVKTLLDAEATKNAILRYLESELAPTLNTNDRVLFFFAGHGHTRVYSGRQFGYLVPYDAEDEATYISMEKLLELSTKMGAAKHQLYLLDACFGGLITTRGGSLDAQGSGYIGDLMRRKARQVLTAGGKDQQVVDGHGPRGYGVFAGYLLEALEQGFADANGDGFVTFSELTGYLVPRASNEYQTPGYSTLADHQSGEFVFNVAQTAGQEVAP